MAWKPTNLTSTIKAAKKGGFDFDRIVIDTVAKTVTLFKGKESDDRDGEAYDEWFRVKNARQD